MHHRIKNNLQTVADLLSLEMSASPSPVARKSLRDSVGRIKSIAAVHELLSLEQLRLTDITALARQVCDISLKHFVRPDRRIVAEITGPPIYLPSKQATALALIINELVSNALEHAFPDRLLSVPPADRAEPGGAGGHPDHRDSGRGLAAGLRSRDTAEGAWACASRAPWPKRTLPARCGWTAGSAGGHHGHGHLLQVGRQ